MSLHPESPIGPKKTYRHPALSYDITDIEIMGKMFRGAVELIEFFINEINKQEYYVGITSYPELDIGSSSPTLFVRTVLIITPDKRKAWEYRYDLKTETLTYSAVDPIKAATSRENIEVSSPYDEVALVNLERSNVIKRIGRTMALIDTPPSDQDRIIEICKELWPVRIVTVLETTVMVGSKHYYTLAQQEMEDLASIAQEYKIPVPDFKKLGKKSADATELLNAMIDSLITIKDNPNISVEDKAGLAIDWLNQAQSMIDDPRMGAGKEEIAAFKAEGSAIAFEIKELLRIASEKEVTYTGYPQIEFKGDPYIDLTPASDVSPLPPATDLSLSCHNLMSSAEDVETDWYLDLDGTDRRINQLRAYSGGDFIFKSQRKMGNHILPHVEAVVPAYVANPVRIARGELPREDRFEFTGNGRIDDPYAKRSETVERKSFWENILELLSFWP